MPLLERSTLNPASLSEASNQCSTTVPGALVHADSCSGATRRAEPRRRPERRDGIGRVVHRTHVVCRVVRIGFVRDAHRLAVVRERRARESRDARYALAGIRHHGPEPVPSAAAVPVAVRVRERAGIRRAVAVVHVALVVADLVRERLVAEAAGIDDVERRDGAARSFAAHRPGDAARIGVFGDQRHDVRTDPVAQRMHRIELAVLPRF